MSQIGHYYRITSFLKGDTQYELGFDFPQQNKPCIFKWGVVISRLLRVSEMIS